MTLAGLKIEFELSKSMWQHNKNEQPGTNLLYAL